MILDSILGVWRLECFGDIGIYVTVADIMQRFIEFRDRFANENFRKVNKTWQRKTLARLNTLYWKLR